MNAGMNAPRIDTTETARGQHALGMLKMTAHGQHALGMLKMTSGKGREGQ